MITTAIKAKTLTDEVTPPDGQFQQTSEIQNLPEETLMHIFSQLNARDIFAPSLVCRQWNVLLNDTQLWRHFLQRDFTRVIKDGPKEQYQGLCSRSNSNLVRGIYSQAEYDLGGRVKLPSVNDRAVFCHVKRSSNTRSSGDIFFDIENGTWSKPSNPYSIDHTNSVLLTNDARCISCLDIGAIDVFDLKKMRAYSLIYGYKIGPALSSAVLIDEQKILLQTGYPDTPMKLGFVIYDLDKRLCEKAPEGLDPYNDTVHPIRKQGKVISTTNATGTIKIWDLKTGVCEKTIDQEDPSIKFVCLTKEDKLISANSSGTIRIRDLVGDACEMTFDLNFELEEECLFALSNNEKLVVVHPDGKLHILNFNVSHEKVFEELATSFDMERFMRMPLQERNKIYGALYQILKPSRPCDRYGEYAFLDQNNLCSTLEQKALAIRHYLTQKMADQFEGNGHEQLLAMEKFLKLPIDERNNVYGALYQILKPSSPCDRHGEYAFHGQEGLSATPQQKAQAIRNALLLLN